jgi:arylsulfatase
VWHLFDRRQFLGATGAAGATPNLDRLARRGIRFTHFHNTARCCPTRASLLTGLYPHQTGVGHMVDNPKPFPGYTGDLNRRSVTIAEVLRPAGYRTLMSGKWHVTPVTESKHNWPLQRGFDSYYGIIHGAASYFDPVTLTRGNQPAEPEGKDFYFTDAIAENAVRYVEEFGRGPDPFFLYVAFTSPHWPLHAIEADVARYKGRYKDGWDALRAERHRRMIEMGVVERRWALTPRDSRVAAWKSTPRRSTAWIKASDAFSPRSRPPAPARTR